MENALYFFAAVIFIQLLILILILNRTGKHKKSQDTELLIRKTESLEQQSARLETLMREELERNRESFIRNEKDARRELVDTLRQFESATGRQMEQLRTKSGETARENREELKRSIETLVASNEQRLDRMREVMENKITQLQKDNNDKLEQMRETVDEKLHKTLEARLGESFKQVSERLEQVHHGLGEMQHLASGVGDLKKVLSNIKTRGNLGEYQLENLLEQLLTPDQYGKNIAVRPGSGDRVEFAVKLPGRQDDERPVWLPIDAKFPTEDYQQLLDAYDEGDLTGIEQCKKNLVTRIKAEAKKISDKYLEPPHTTDFGILFLPFEGLYAEVLRLDLFEILQREYKVMIAGPTTISAFLNSLQMGFRTLAIEKRSSEVWKLLGSVKNDFGKFGSILEKTKKKLDEAGKVIEDAGVRSRAIERSLRDVQELPQVEKNRALPESLDEPEYTTGTEAVN
jgi:DNA recombination protein RmuC